MIQLAAAGLLALHGLIHLIGFVVPWRLAAFEGFPYRMTALNGAVALGETGIRVVGLIWLAVAIGFVVAAIGVMRGESWALPVVVVLALLSLVVCVIGLPEAIAGIVLDVAILAVAAYLIVTGQASATR